MPAIQAERDVDDVARMFMLIGVIKAISARQYGGALVQELMASYAWFEIWNHPVMGQEGDFILVDPLVIANADPTFHIEDITVRRWYKASRTAKSFHETDRAWRIFLELTETPIWVRISDKWYIPEQCRGQRVRMAVMSLLDAVTEPYKNSLVVGVRADRTPVAALRRQYGE